MSLRACGLAAVCFATALTAHVARAADGCDYYDLPDLPARPGHVQFMEPGELQPLKEALPEVEDQAVQAILGSTETIWYDERAG